MREDVILNIITYTLDMDMDISVHLIGQYQIFDFLIIPMASKM